MVSLIRCCQSGKFISVSSPVKITAVNNRTAYTCCMTIHILCCGMRHNISPPLKRAAVDRCSKCIIYDKRNPMLMCRLCKFFKIQNDQCRICNRLSKYCLCIILKCCFQFFFRAVRINKSSRHTHFTDCMSKKVICSAIQGRCTYNMISLFCNIHNGIKISCLTG